ncbi:Uncharacterised protein [Clostridioides difficile]|nr:Uncharacterised protein [Clostridioides difficile]
MVCKGVSRDQGKAGKAGFILTKWYVKFKAPLKSGWACSRFILTKWYVKFDEKEEYKRDVASFILTKWYVKHVIEIIYNMIEKVLY